METIRKTTTNKTTNKTEHVYLLQLSINAISQNNIYKIGRTQQGLGRFSGYEYGHKVLLFKKCIDCKTMEQKIKELFNKKYTLVQGLEHFEGDKDSMIKDIENLIKNEINEATKITIKNTVNKMTTKTIKQTTIINNNDDDNETTEEITEEIIKKITKKITKKNNKKNKTG